MRDSGDFGGVGSPPTLSEMNRHCDDGRGREYVRDRTASHGDLGGTWNDRFAVRECVAGVDVRSRKDASCG